MVRLARSRLVAIGFAFALTASAVGCASVQPWEREILARPDMAWEPDALEDQLDSHIAFSKEGALVGGGTGGGGCGCN